MTKSAMIVGERPHRLWGLSSVERITRQLRSVGIDDIDTGATRAPGAAPLLAVAADFLFEPRTFSALLGHDRAVLVCPETQQVAAAVGPGDTIAGLVGADSATVPRGITVLSPADLAAFDRNLRKSAAPLLRAYADNDEAALESLLYGNAYKGITDLVTKWWWPRPARYLVGWCARLGITPNMVTLTGLLLVLIATGLFATGGYLAGLACGWLMTLLDTVDGKLARVTVTSSRLGHWLDHGMDIVHPPFWYVYWGVGLGLGMDGLVCGYTVGELALAIVTGYIAGRLLEAAFHTLGHCSMFAWRPFDAYFRLVTARRNPCLIILTIATFAGRPDLGYAGVAAWTVLSSAIMALRLVYAAALRLRGAPLQSWLIDPRQAAAEHPRAFTTFAGTRRAYD